MLPSPWQVGRPQTSGKNLLSHCKWVKKNITTVASSTEEY